MRGMPASRSTRTPAAFTLIEIMVGILLVGLLVAVSAFAYTRVAHDGGKATAHALAEEFAREATQLAARTDIPVGQLSTADLATIKQDTDQSSFTVLFGAPGPDGAVWAGVTSEEYCTPVWFPADPGPGVLGATVQAATCQLDGGAPPAP